MNGGPYCLATKLEIQPSLNALQTVADAIQLCLQVRRNFSIVHLITAKVEDGSVGFSLTHRQLAKFDFNTLKRCLKALQMFQQQVFDVVGHGITLSYRAHLGYNLLRRIAQIIGGDNRQAAVRQYVLALLDIGAL